MGKIATESERWVDRLPAVMRSISGFNSSLAVVVTSIIFVLTINEAVMKTEIGWIGGMEILIMLMGPVIIAWNFVNVHSTLESVIQANTEQTEDDHPAATRKCYPKGYITPSDAAMEREVFGVSTMLLRALVGFIAAHSICFTSLVYTWTIRTAVLSGKVMPGEFDILIAVIGPIITSWNFVRAANTINVLISGGTMFMNFRTWLSTAIAPKTK